MPEAWHLSLQLWRRGNDTVSQHAWILFHFVLAYDAWLPPECSLNTQPQHLDTANCFTCTATFTGKCHKGDHIEPARNTRRKCDVFVHWMYTKNWSFFIYDAEQITRLLMMLPSWTKMPVPLASYSQKGHHRPRETTRQLQRHKRCAFCGSGTKFSKRFLGNHPWFRGINHQFNGNSGISICYYSSQFAFVPL